MYIQFSLKVQATVHDGLKNLYRCIFHENWDINSKVITAGGLK